LGSDDEILEKADNIIAEELEELNRDSKYCYTSTEIAKMYNGRMQGNDLISFLVDRKIVRKINGFYELTRKYSNKGYDAYRYSIRYNCHGLRRLKKTLVWTEAGREFLKKLIN
jgi:phage antirepressor YoqD-like protein